MDRPRLTQLELQVQDTLWHGACSVREILETFPQPNRPAYTAVQTVVYRLQRKKAFRCVERISNTIFSRPWFLAGMPSATFVDEPPGLFGDRAKLVMAHLVESGELTLEDVKEAEKAIRKSSGRSGTQ